MNIYKRFLEIGKEMDKLKAEKLAIECQIWTENAEKYKAKPEGRVTVEECGFKAIVTNGYKYDIDQEEAGKFPDGFKLKFSFDKKIYKGLSTDEQNEADKAITMTPKKPSFKVEVIDGD